MLTFLAFAMVIVFMTLIMTKRMSPLIALILVPIAFGIIGGFWKGLGPMMLDGIRNLAPTGVMLMFAILYFGIMIDAGLFEPFVQKIVRIVHGDPMKIVVGTAVLALLVSRHRRHLHPAHSRDGRRCRLGAVRRLQAGPA